MNEIRKNGREGAENSPNKHTTGIQSPSNDSFQQSLYIAALGLSLGLTGVVSPVMDDRNDIHYEFDFYHLESGTLIKVFQTLDETECEKYSSHPSGPLIIIDGHSAGFEFKKCPCCEIEHLDGGYGAASTIHDYPDNLVFYDNALWEPFDHPDLGKLWRIITPYAIRMVLREDDDDEPVDDEE